MALRDITDFTMFMNTIMVSQAPESFRNVMILISRCQCSVPLEILCIVGLPQKMVVFTDSLVIVCGMF